MINPDKRYSVDEVRAHILWFLVKNEVLQNLFEVLLLWVKGHRLEQAHVGLFWHLEITLIVEQIANQQVILATLLSFSFGRNR